MSRWLAGVYRTWDAATHHRDFKPASAFNVFHPTFSGVSAFLYRGAIFYSLSSAEFLSKVVMLDIEISLRINIH